MTPAAQAAPKPKECPYPGEVAYDLEKVEEVLKSAPSCDAAFKVFSLCMMGATRDVAMSGIVIDKCEQDFVPKLSKAQQRTEKATDRCERKARNTAEGRRAAPWRRCARPRWRAPTRGAGARRSRRGGRKVARAFGRAHVAKRGSAPHHRGRGGRDQHGWQFRNVNVKSGRAMQMAED